MTDQLRKAAQDALDALLDFTSECKHMERSLPGEVDTAIDRLRAALAQPVQSGWLRAVDEAMVCSHLGIADASDDYETAKKKLNDLIRWNIDVDRYFEADKRKQSEQSGWVGLTDEEMRIVLRECSQDTFEKLRIEWQRTKAFGRAIESALRAKNAVPDRVQELESENERLRDQVERLAIDLALKDGK